MFHGAGKLALTTSDAPFGIHEDGLHRSLAFTAIRRRVMSGDIQGLFTARIRPY
jgi:hypothetical protein